MIYPPVPTEPTDEWKGLTLAEFLARVLRAYPGALEVSEKLCKDEVINRAFHYYMVKEHFAGIKILQRGLTYYITRLTSVRNTPSYELYNYVLWNETGLEVDVNNPKMAYTLFSEKWHEWVTVPHNI